MTKKAVAAINPKWKIHGRAATDKYPWFADNLDSSGGRAGFSLVTSFLALRLQFSAHLQMIDTCVSHSWFEVQYDMTVIMSASESQTSAC